MNNQKQDNSMILENSLNQYYNIDFFSTHIDFDEIEKLECKGEEFLFKNLLYLFQKYNSNSADLKMLRNAFALAKKVHKTQNRESGAAFVTHPLIVALLAIPYSPCAHFLSATLLHDTIEDYTCETKHVSKKDCRKYISDKIKNEFGETVYDLIEGVSKVSEIKSEKRTTEIQEIKQEIAKQTIEKIFIYSAKDCRILLIKIFDRLHNIITIAGKKDPIKREKKVQEAISIYVASAKRLGLWNVKNLLENACERALNNDNTNLQKIQEEETLEKSENIRKKNIIQTLQKILPDSKILLEKNSFMNRAVHSSYILIEVETEEECFRVFSVLNKKYYLKKNTFSDYISRPKINKYQALHAQYIVNNAEIIEIHIVSTDMRKRNIFGVFLDVKLKNYSLPLLSGVSLNILNRESEQTLVAIKNRILTPQLTIHNVEMGRVYIAKGATALDAGISLYPDIFQNISDVYINSTLQSLNTIIKNNDIIEFQFADRSQLERNWLDYSFLYKEKISNILARLSYSEKSIKGHDILQSVFDEKRIGLVDVICDNVDFLDFVNSDFTSVQDLYVSIYEGRVRGYECLYLYEEFKKQSSNNKKNNTITNKKLQFTSSFSLFSDIETVFSTVAQKTSVQIKNLVIEKEKEKMRGSVVVESSQKNLVKFMQKLQPCISCSYSFSVLFLLKILFFLAFPIGVSVLISTFLASGVSENYFLFYFGAGGILAANIITYVFFNNYFAIIRNKISILLSVIAINFIVSLGYIYIFFQHDYNIYNLHFYFSLILLVFSMGFPALFVSKKNITKNNTESFTLSEYKKKQKQKVIGYLLRFSAIIVWGLDPLFLKYSPLSEISLDIRMGLLFFGGALFMLSLIVVFKRRLIKSLYKIPINGAFKLLIIAKLLFAFLSVVSLQYTSGTSFILLNNFAPIFSLLIAFIFWRSSVLYLQDKKNIIKMFIIFLLGSIGTSLIFYKDIVVGGVLSLWGNIFAILTMLSDVLFMTVVIRYAPSLKNNQSYFVNFYLYLASFLCFLPFLLFNISEVLQLSSEKIFWAIGVGALWGLGTLLNYEAFRRMDGFIGFLMFNLAILITISVESFFLNEIAITPFLLLGSALVIGASILAEMINTKCEQENITK